MQEGWREKGRESGERDGEMERDVGVNLILVANTGIWAKSTTRETLFRAKRLLYACMVTELHCGLGYMGPLPAHNVHRPRVAIGHRVGRPATSTLQSLVCPPSDTTQHTLNTSTKAASSPFTSANSQPISSRYNIIYSVARPHCTTRVHYCDTYMAHMSASKHENIIFLLFEQR